MEAASTEFLKIATGGLAMGVGGLDSSQGLFPS